MLKLRTTNFKFKKRFLNKRSALRNEITTHPAWKGAHSLCEIATLLKECDPFTYILSEGMDRDHFFLSFVDFNGVVKHKNVRIVQFQSDWVVKNGTGNFHVSILDLIPDCLHCSKAICQPLA